MIYKNGGDEDYSDLIQGDDRYFIQYHFNDYRSSILRWYPFREGCRILELGAEYGALTGALLDRADHVTALVDTEFQERMIRARYSRRENLTVQLVESDDVSACARMPEESSGFDYIICFTRLEYAASPVDYLRALSRYLKEDGIILLEVENKYGIDNLCGKRDSHSGVPFDSIAGYPTGKPGRGFHRQELIDLTRHAGFSNYKFYYPMPDFIAPRAIYTDSYQPEQNMGERLVTYDRDSSTLVADSRTFYLEAAANQAFPFVANSYLLELTISDDASTLSDVNYVTLTGYRDRTKAFSTMLRESSSVLKRCQYPAGIDYAKKLCSITDSLKARGIPILDMKLSGDALLMEEIEAPTLQQHIAYLAANGISSEDLFALYDRMWHNIMRSSEVKTDSEGYTGGLGAGSLDLGPILEQAYLEMIPLNSFWVNDDILYFDQEYVRENYPARYIIFRCIIHTYGMIDSLESIVPRREMMDHFGIDEAQEDFFFRLESKLSEEENPGMFFLPPSRDLGRMQHNREILGECYGR